MEEFTIIGLRELRENMEMCITKVQQGGSFVVVRKSKVVFRIAPPGERIEKEEGRSEGKEEEKKLPAAKKTDDLWETVVDFTRIQKGGVPIEDILTRL